MGRLTYDNVVFELGMYNLIAKTSCPKALNPEKCVRSKLQNALHVDIFAVGTTSWSSSAKLEHTSSLREIP